MSQIAVPAQRPAAVASPDNYTGRHRWPEPPPLRPVGEGTRERRPHTLAEADGPTRSLNVSSGVVAAARAVWRLGR